MGIEESLLGNTPTREKRKYTVPESLRSGIDGAAMPQTLALRLPTANDEIQASKIGKFDLARTRYEAVKRSICELDGKSVNNADGAVDAFFERCHPKLRSLLLDSYDRMTSASASEEDSFFKSETIQVA